jgi:aspartokinase/homoserine dehydrogenase 1
MIVAKFGGTVLSGADGIRRVVGEIRSLEKPLLVVVSAFADVTNRLERIASMAPGDTAGAHDALHALVEYHRAIAHDVLTRDAYLRWLDAIEPFVARLEEVIDGLGIVRDLSARTLDLIVHFGERFSSSLLAAALADAPANDGSTFDGSATDRSAADAVPMRVRAVSALEVIITNAAHRYARPDMELTRDRVEERLRPALAANDVVVIEGYIARSASGQATTMGRESSNYSATMLAGLLGAAEVRIYTSVPGILTADPALIAESRTLPRMSYGMANTLAELGAKVLHPRTVMPVERSRIPLVIASIGGASTTIGEACEGGCSIVLLPGAELVTIDTATTSSEVEGFIRAVTAEAPVIWYQRFRRRLQILLATPFPHPSLPLHLISDAAGASSLAVAVVSAVQEEELCGSDLASFFNALGNATPLAMQGGINSHAVSVALDRSAGMGAVRELHRRFVEMREEVAGWQPHAS